MRSVVSVVVVAAAVSATMVVSVPASIKATRPGSAMVDRTGATTTTWAPRTCATTARHRTTITAVTMAE
uniref:Putative secreted peptide n=1 Tax=Anopheles braziliensis TaxID=58242 RepID=A0A2M3ZQ50_9DIPT